MKRTLVFSVAAIALLLAIMLLRHADLHRAVPAPEAIRDHDMLENTASPLFVNDSSTAETKNFFKLPQPRSARNTRPPDEPKLSKKGKKLIPVVDNSMNAVRVGSPADEDAEFAAAMKRDLELGWNSENTKLFYDLRSKTRGIHSGMPKSEVLLLLGQPSLQSTDGLATSFTYWSATNMSKQSHPQDYPEYELSFDEYDRVKRCGWFWGAR